MTRAYYKSKNPIYDQLTKHFYDGVTMKQLIEVAEEISKKLAIPSCTRRAKRNKELLIQWYSTNWDQIKNLVLSIVPIDENGNELSSFKRKRKFLWKFKTNFQINEQPDKYDNIQVILSDESDQSIYLDDIDWSDENIFPLNS